MGNAPSEYNGATCSECRASLRPLREWKDLEQRGFNNGYRNGQFHVFHAGEYYRPVDRSDYYLCRDCFDRPRREAEQRQRQEEEQRRRAAEEERKRQEEQERRRRQQEEERRKQKEYDASQKLEVQQWIQSKNEDYYENRAAEYQEHTRKQVLLGVYNRLDPEQTEEMIVEKSAADCFLEPFDDFQVNMRSYFGNGGGEKVESEIDNVLEILYIRLFYDWPEQNKEQFNVKELKIMQTFLVEIYLSHCVFHEVLDPDNLDAVSNELHEVLINLNNFMRSTKEQLDFTRVLFVCISPLGNEDFFENHNASTILESINECKSSVKKKLWKANSRDLSSDIAVLAKKYVVKFLEMLVENFDIVIDTDDASQRWRTACCELLIVHLSLFSVKKNYSQHETNLLCLVKNNIWRPRQTIRLLRSLSNRRNTETSSKANKIDEIVFTILTRQISSDHICESAKDKVSLIDYIESHKTTEIIKQLERIGNADEQRTVADIISELTAIEAITFDVASRVKAIVEDAHRIIADAKSKSSKTESKTETNYSQELIAKLLLTKELSEDKLSSVLATLCCAVYDVFLYMPRATQMVSWTLLALSKKGCLQEIFTGEGKSCIIAMFAVFLHLKNKSVDIVTSSSVLAQRDAFEWKKFYDLFLITSDHNISKVDNEDRQKCYNCNIVYGTVDAFAADILKQEFQLKDVRPTRHFDAVIVDEIDFMLLDQGIHFTYLTHQAVFLRHVETVLAMVWSMVNRIQGVITESGKAFIIGPPAAFHKAVYDAVVDIDLDNNCLIESPIQILDVAETEHILEAGFSEQIFLADSTNIGKMLEKLSQSTMLKILAALSDYFPYSFGAYTLTEAGSLREETCGEIPILVFNSGSCALLSPADNILDNIAKEIKDNIQLESNSTSENEVLQVPRCFITYINDRIKIWVKNAFTAKQLKDGRDYVIEEGTNRYKEVLPVAFGSTGVIERNKQWGDGLHQFLQLKHNLVLKPISLVTNFMPHLSFFKRYDGNIFGVSGTLGSNNEHAFLNRHCSVDMIPIPTARPKKFYEVDGIITQNRKEWLEAICNIIQKELAPKSFGGTGRAALIICEDINSSKIVAEALGKIEKNTPAVYMYTRSNDSDKQIIERALMTNEVIVATNLAGRGSDIKIGQEVEKSGGLFVLVTFLPQNSRVERQAFGRSARKGLPGSGQLVINLENVSATLLQTASNTMHMKEIRENLCNAQLTLLEKEDVEEVMLKDRLFAKYCEFLARARTDILNLTEDKTERELMLGAMHEAWAIWLQNVTEKIEDKTVGDENSLMADLQSLCHAAHSKLLNRESPTENIYHILKFGHEMIFDKKFNEASAFFTRCINLDEKWASFAYYARAYCSISSSKPLQLAIDDLDKASEKMLNYQSTLSSMFAFISTWGTTNPDENMLCKQLQNRIQIFNSYQDNIKKALDVLHTLKPDDQADADPTDILSLVPDADSLMHDELSELWDLGLRQVYSVKRKPRFLWDAFSAMLIGLCEIAVGALLCVFSLGTAFQVGMGLISEGVSDVIEGAKGMITGAFDLTQWAIQKAISIAITLVTAGVCKVFNDGVRVALKSVKEAATSAVTKLKELPKQLLNKFSQEGFKASAKQSMKVVGKKIAMEFAQQVAVAAVNYGEEKIMDEIMKQIYETIKTSVAEKIEKSVQSGELRDNLNVILSSETIKKCTPETAKESILLISRNALDSFLIGSEWQARISDIFRICLGNVKEKAEKAKNENILVFLKVLEVADDLTNFAYGISIINEIISKFIPRLCQELKEYVDENQLKPGENIDPSNNAHLALIPEIGKKLAEDACEAIIGLMQQNITALINRKIQSKTTNTVKKATEKTLRITGKLAADIKRSIAVTANKHNLDKTTTLPQAIEEHSTAIQSDDTSVTALDIRVLSESLSVSVRMAQQELDGGLTVITEIEPSKIDDNSQTVTVIHRKSSTNQKGHYDALVGNKVVEINVENGNSMFHAIAQGLNPNASKRDLDQIVRAYRKSISLTLRKDPAKWGEYIERKDRTQKLRKAYSLDSNFRINEVKKTQKLNKFNFEIASKTNEAIINALGKKSAHETGPDGAANDSALRRAMTVSLTEGNEPKPLVRSFMDGPQQFLSQPCFASSHVVRDMISNQIAQDNALEAFKLTCISTTSTFDRTAAAPKKLSGNFKQRVLTQEVSEFKALANRWHDSLQKFNPSIFDRTQLQQFYAWVDGLQFNNPNDDAVKSVMDAFKTT